MALSSLELFNVAILIALIFFSAWHFYLRFVSNRVATIKDLLLAYVTGGALAVATMVFGVTGDIIDDTKAIRQDTVSIRTTLREGSPPIERPERADPLVNLENEKLAEILEVNQQQTQILRMVLSGLADLQKNSGQANQPNSVDEELAELIAANQEQTQLLRRGLGTIQILAEKVDLNNQLISRILEASGSNQEFPTEFSGSQFAIQLDLVCSLPQIQLSVARLSPSCVIRPSENR